MSKNVVATIREDAPFVPAGRYYLFSEPAAWTLMPTDEGSGQLPLTLDKGAYTLTADAAPTEPDEMQGMLRVYKLRPVALTLTDSSGNHAALSVSYGADNLAVLQSWGFDCRSAGEPTDKPAETFTVAVKNGGGLLPKAKLEVWRDGDALRFFRRDKGLYTGKGSLQSGELPIRLIRFYRLCGGIRTETRVSGGGVSVDREAAYWSQWEHPFSLNPHGRAIEAAVQAEPIKTEQIQHDERYVQLRVRVNGGFCEMQFTPDSLAVFDALIPNLEFDEVALTDRTPTPVEQLDILAGLCDRGFVTRKNLSRRRRVCSGKSEEFMTEQEKYMKAALKLAQKAADEGEVPVGAVVVCDGKIVGRGRNRRETKKNALHHAEIEAIEKACKKLGGWRLHRCDLYVTLEPCPMCAGALINSRMKTVYYGAPDPKAGSCGSLINLFALPYNHQPALVSGVLEQECADILRNFFRELRKKRKEIRKIEKSAVSDAE